MIVDFKGEQVMHKYTDFEFSTGCGHLVYRKSNDTLYHVGGFNSDGVNYQMKMSDLRWREN